jgi:hypothetical protein
MGVPHAAVRAGREPGSGREARVARVPGDGPAGHLDAPLAFSGSTATPAKALLVAWACLQLAGDTTYGVLVLMGQWTLASPVFLLWMAGFGCLAAAARHPTMATLGTSQGSSLAAPVRHAGHRRRRRARPSGASHGAAGPGQPGQPAGHHQRIGPRLPSCPGSWSGAGQHPDDEIGPTGPRSADRHLRRLRTPAAGACSPGRASGCPSGPSRAMPGSGSAPPAPPARTWSRSRWVA